MRRQTNIGEEPAAAATSAFVVGRDSEGHWLAIESHGFGGGIFVNKEAAIHYALAETARRPGAVALTDEPVALLALDQMPNHRRPQLAIRPA